MIPTLGELAALCGGRLSGVSPGVRPAGFATDSRRVRAGALFCALPGEHTDGRRYVGEALAAGAVAALAAEGTAADLPAQAPLLLVDDAVAALGRAATAWMAPLRPRLRVGAITGSVGKTTTRDLAAAALGGRRRVLVPEGNYNTEIGLPLTCLRLGPEHEVAVFELAMRGSGEIARLARICRPEVAAMTVIGPSHLEVLGSIERIAAAKEELLAALPRDGLAVLNAADSWQRGMAARCPARVVWYGPDADVAALDPEPVPGRGTRFRLRLPDGDTAPLLLPLPGRHQVGNALAAAGLAFGLGAGAAEIAEGLAGAAPPGGRLAISRIGGPDGEVTLLDDAYNASPASALAALDVLGQLAAPAGALILLGDMLELGPLTEPGHREVGRAIAASPARALGTVGPAGAFVREEAALPGDGFATPEEAAEWALTLLRPGDVVLVKGSRGMQMERAVSRLRHGLVARRA